MRSRRFWSVLLVVGMVGVALSVWIAPAAALDQGAKAPEIGIKDLSGKPVSLASLAGKVVVVDFWATWCAPCKEELPVLERLYKKYAASGLVIVGVSVDEKLPNVRDFLKKMPLSFPIAHDADHAVSNRYRPSKMPTSYIIDKKGIVRHVHGGFHADDAAKLEAEIRALLTK